MHLSPAEILNLTLPQLHALCTGSRPEELIDVPSGQAGLDLVSGLQAAEAKRLDSILLALEHGEIF